MHHHRLSLLLFPRLPSISHAPRQRQEPLHFSRTTGSAKNLSHSMPSHHPEPPSLAPFELQADPAPPPAKGGGKMHRLLRSAFKRGDSASAGSGEEADQLSRSASESSSSAASSGRPPSGGRAGRRGGDGDRSSRESFELDGETRVIPCLFTTKFARLIAFAFRFFFLAKLSESFRRILAKEIKHMMSCFVEFCTSSNLSSVMFCGFGKPAHFENATKDSDIM